MKERERAVVSGLVVMMLILWLGFIFHQSPRFAGSFWGGMLGLGGAILMLVPLAYLVVKRSKWLKPRVKEYVSMRTLLAWHIYAGILGPILVLLHTGHKFESTLGIVLTGTTLVVVLSGFVGRYLMNRFSTEIREKKALLSELNAAYDEVRSELAGHPEQAAAVRPFSGFLSRTLVSFFVESGEPQPAGAASLGTAIRLAESIADVEYAVNTHEKFKRWFSKWLKWHIAVSLFLYVLMALHIWGAIHFGLRWFEPNAADYFNSSGQQQYDASWNARQTPLRETSAAVDAFHNAFANLFRTTWRPPARINGIATTVFDYAEWARQVEQPQSDFSLAVAALKNVYPPAIGGGNREKAFWINVYNFTAMKMAAENYPVDSITSRKISLDKNPWGMKAITVGEQEYSIRQIEGEKLLDQFDDPRIIFAVSCAAVSCPDRTNEIFSEDRLNRQLDTMIQSLFRNPNKGLRLDRAANTLTISWIVQADQRLFKEENNNGVLDFVSRNAPAEVGDWIQAHRAAIQVKFFKHDWALNDLALAEKEETE